MIISVTETDVVIDANHPLAGKNLNFEIELKYFVN
jgi:FKBP-type peptidyl-prolyl cis-trans isomerase 2